MDWLTMSNLPVLVGFLILTLAVGGISGVATRRGVATWYRTLAKPSFNPPNWVFAPVWTTLFVLMAIAAWRVWPATGLTGTPMLLFFAQLALNAAWSVIFFNAHRIGGALVEVIVFLAFIVMTTVAFWQIDLVAGLLFLPYIAWVSFASVLTGAIWRLNGPGLRRA